MAASEGRPEVILAALLYLLTAYRRCPCPSLAACIARHFRCLARHPRTERVVGEVAEASSAEWDAVADGGAVTGIGPAAVRGAVLH